MTLQNNSAVPRKLVTIPKLFCYAILSKIVLLCNFYPKLFCYAILSKIVLLWNFTQIHFCSFI